MVARYSFHPDYNSPEHQAIDLPNLTLIEGGDFGPGQYAPVIVSEYFQTRLQFYKWGDTEVEPDSPKSACPLFVKAENFFALIEASGKLPRCVVPANGYYTQANDKGIAYKISIHDDRPLAYAAVRMYSADRVEQTFAILTLPAPPELLPYTARVPLILNQADQLAWIHKGTTPQRLLNCHKLNPYRTHEVHQLAVPMIERLEQPVAA